MRLDASGSGRRGSERPAQGARAARRWSVEWSERLVKVSTTASGVSGGQGETATSRVTRDGLRRGTARGGGFSVTPVLYRRRLQRVSVDCLLASHPRRTVWLRARLELATRAQPRAASDQTLTIVSKRPAVRPSLLTLFANMLAHNCADTYRIRLPACCSIAPPASGASKLLGSLQPRSPCRRRQLSRAGSIASQQGDG